VSLEIALLLPRKMLLVLILVSWEWRGIEWLLLRLLLI
jgi:hypothetical protein